MSRADPIAAASAAALKAGSTSFAAAARLFDAPTRRDAELLYAWCRHCDDVIDGQVLGHGRRADEADPQTRLDELRALTRSALAGEPMSDPAFAAFQRVALARRIPPRYPLDLLEGFQMDVDGRSYERIEDTLSYCYHVAGVVGLMMAVIMGVQPDDEDTLDRACDLGLAFQLTNIARDVIEDAARGRVYLPRAWLAEAGLGLADVADPRRRDAVHAVAMRLVQLAELYYRSAGAGLARLPLRAAMAIGAARAVYCGIGAELARLGPAAWDRRIATSRRQKLALVAGGGLAAAATRRRKAVPCRGELWIRPGRSHAAALS